MADYERVAMVKPEVFVYKIPPLGSNRGYRYCAFPSSRRSIAMSLVCRAAEWKLDSPDWTGRIRLVALGSKFEIRLEDKGSGKHWWRSGKHRPQE